MSLEVLQANQTSSSPHAFLRPFRRLRSQTGCLRGLDFLWLEITQSCNLTCRHCYTESGPHLPISDRMQMADWCRALDEARSSGCRRVQFIGGEPTVHPGLNELIVHAKSSGFRFCEVFTNATLLRDDLVDTFRRHKVLVATSFYSSDPGTHDRITGQAGSFDSTVEGIKKLVQKRIPIRAGVILLDENATHLKKAKALLRQLGVRWIGKDEVRGVGRGERYMKPANDQVQLCGDCWKRRLCITSTGDAYPCVFSRATRVGNFLTDGIQGILKVEELHTFRRAVYLGELGGAR